MATGLGCQVKHTRYKLVIINAGFSLQPGGFPLYFLFLAPVPNINTWLLTASILDQAVTVRIMWSCYGNLGTMLIISNYTNRIQRPVHNSV